MGRFLRRWGPVLAAVAVVLVPVLVGASEGGGEPGRSPLYNLIMKFVNFGILAGGLYYFLRKPAAAALANRQETVRKALEDARKAQEAAEAKYREYQQKVAALDAEVEQIRADFKAEGERQHERILAEAAQAAESLRAQAERAAENEVKRARDELRTRAAELAVQLAEEILAKAYTEDDQKKAVRLTIQNIEGLH